MMLILYPKAEKQFKDLSKTNQILIANKLRKLPLDESLLDKEKLAGYRDIYRIRMGDYRIFYRKIKTQIYVVLIAHRKEVYELLKRII
jgi:mRNA interferase RelE/StbE